MRKIGKYFVFCLLAVVIFGGNSCKGRSEAEPTQQETESQEQPKERILKYVIDVSPLRTLDKTELRALITDSVADSYLKYEVKAYRLTYKSTYVGDTLATTALMLLPADSTIERRLCVYMHGTNIPIDPVSAAKLMPSNYFNTNILSEGEVSICGLPLASSGFCVVMPDYIGYGETKNREHPFVYYPELQYANIDALRAMKEWLSLSGKQQVWLGGYSQGGGAALSLHYYIQTNYNTEFTVVSSSCLSGPYNFAGQIAGIVNEGISVPTSLVSWSAYVLNHFALHRYPDEIFSFHVTDQRSAIIHLALNVEDLFRPEFFKGVMEGKDTEWIEASKKNSFHEGWKPEGKVYLHHGTQDNIVPYFNSKDAYKGLKDAGGDVTLYSLEGCHHLNVIKPYIQKTLELWKP